MKPNKIIYIFCSLDDCMLIKKTIPSFPNGFMLSFNIANIERSIKQIRTIQLKSIYKNGDYLVLIDNPSKLIFENDYTSSNIFHFSNIDAFYKWFSSMERGG